MNKIRYRREFVRKLNAFLRRKNNVPLLEVWSEEKLVSLRKKSRWHRGYESVRFDFTLPRWIGALLAPRSRKLYLPRCSRGKHGDAENRNCAKLVTDARANKDGRELKLIFLAAKCRELGSSAGAADNKIHRWGKVTANGGTCRLWNTKHAGKEKKRFIAINVPFKSSRFKNMRYSSLRDARECSNR